MNHFKQCCRSRNASSSLKGQSPYPKKGKQQRARQPSGGNFKGKSKGGNGKGGNTPTRRNSSSTRTRKRHTPLRLSRDSVLSGADGSKGPAYESTGKVQNSVLSGPPQPGMFNSFACDAVHSKLHHTHNESNVAKSKRLYTDTDPMSQTEIITDVQIKKPAHAGSLWMEVKVDPALKQMCALHKFRSLFPYLCRDGMPKEGALAPSTAESTGYSGTDMQSLGYWELHTQNISTKKYHILKFHVLDIDSPRILVWSCKQHTAIGLIKVLCINKAPRRQVDSLTRNASQSQSHSR